MDNISLHVKLEYYNYTGSIKDRPAFNIIYQAIRNGEINKDTIVIESSSGNFALALATICARLGIKFIAVVDPVINKNNERLLNLICHEVIKVSEVDHTGGYLLTRLAVIEKMCRETPGIYWPNQYKNPNNYLSYYHGLGNEVCEHFDRLDYAFIGVSSGGTITGLSMRLKEQFPSIKIIAVDVVGSIIFGGKPQKRYLSGIGASLSSPVLKDALIDDIIHVSQFEIIDGCNELLTSHHLLTGASTGAAYFAVKEYFKRNQQTFEPKVLFLCTDRGNGYLDNVYDPEWKKWLRTKTQ